MFDVAYVSEASVEAALIEKSRLWEKILKLDLSRPLAGFSEMLQISRFDSVIFYWNLIYYVHGGI